MPAELDHWRGFREFCELDKLSGGPDSHMKTVVELARHYHKVTDPVNLAWHAAVYVSVYNVPMYLALIKAAPIPEEVGKIAELLAAHSYKDVVLRRERKRPVGSPTKLYACLCSAAAWATNYASELRDLGDYDTLWNWSSRIQYFGRYAQMKFLETLRQMRVVEPIIPDIRARDGWSPREGLCLLHPEDETCYLLRQGSSPQDLVEVEAIADRTYARFAATINRYEFQVFLCDYKQCVAGRQYPGRSLDSELDHHRKAAQNFALGSEMHEARSRLFPKWALGEERGWDGVRDLVTDFYRRTGVMWSDDRFRYDLMVEERDGDTFYSKPPIEKARTF